MLFEIDGVAAHEEDEWLGTQVQVGDAAIVLNGDVGRCVVTSHDPDTGVTDLDTLGALARYRREGRNEPLPFGVYGAVAVPGRVRVGDAVQPLQDRLLAGDIAISAMLPRWQHARKQRTSGPLERLRERIVDRRPRLVLREHRREGVRAPRST